MRLIPSFAASVCTAAALVSVSALAKLPALSDEAKAKAAETAAKSAWSDKIAGFQLCKAQDRLAGTYAAEMKQAGKDVKPPTTTAACADPGPFVGNTAAVAAGAASGAAPAASPPSAAASVPTAKKS